MIFVTGIKPDTDVGLIQDNCQFSSPLFQWQKEAQFTWIHPICKLPDHILHIYIINKCRKYTLYSPHLC